MRLKIFIFLLINFNIYSTDTEVKESKENLYPQKCCNNQRIDENAIIQKAIQGDSDAIEFLKAHPEIKIKQKYLALIPNLPIKKINNDIDSYNIKYSNEILFTQRKIQDKRCYLYISVENELSDIIEITLDRYYMCILPKSSLYSIRDLKYFIGKELKITIQIGQEKISKEFMIEPNTEYYLFNGYYDKNLLIPIDC